MLRAHIDRHFDGTLSPEGERVMREHLPTCDACRKYYDRHLLLARLDPSALSGEERIARGLGLGRRASWTQGLPLATAVIAAAAVIVLFVHRSSTFPPPSSRSPDFEARGNVLEAPLSRVFVYDVPPDAAPSLAVDSIGASDELAFAYENGGGK